MNMPIDNINKYLSVGLIIALIAINGILLYQTSELSERVEHLEQQEQLAFEAMLAFEELMAEQVAFNEEVYKLFVEIVG